MTATAEQIQPNTTEVFRFIEPEDIPRLLELGKRFYDESEFADFSTFSEDHLREVANTFVAMPDENVLLVFAPNGGQIEGFFGFQIVSHYTVEPMALGWLLYVAPEYRRSPAGRILLNLAEDYAKRAGCCIFYAGAMSGIEAVSKTLPNLYMKHGFEPLWWGRKILKEDTDG